MPMTSGSYASASAKGTGAGAGTGIGDAATKKLEPTRPRGEHAAELLLKGDYVPAKAARTAVKMTRVNCIVNEGYMRSFENRE